MNLLESIEPAADFAVRTVKQMRRDGIIALSPKQESVDAFTRDVRDRFKGTTHSKGCTSWWSEPSGFNHSIWPGSSVEFRELFTNLELDDFEVTRARTGSPTS